MIGWLTSEEKTIMRRELLGQDRDQFGAIWLGFDEEGWYADIAEVQVRGNTAASVLRTITRVLEEA